MRERWNAREADRSRQAVCNPRNPFMVSVTFGDNRGNRKNTRRVAGRETASFTEHGNMALKKGIGIVARYGNCIRPQAPADQFNHNVRYGAVQVGFAREQRGLFRVRILAYEAVHIKCRGNQSGYNTGVRPAEYFIKLVKGSRISEMDHYVRIRGDE